MTRFQGAEDHQHRDLAGGERAHGVPHRGQVGELAQHEVEDPAHQQDRHRGLQRPPHPGVAPRRAGARAPARPSGPSVGAQRRGVHGLIRAHAQLEFSSSCPRHSNGFPSESPVGGWWRRRDLERTGGAPACVPGGVHCAHRCLALVAFGSPCARRRGAATTRPGRRGRARWATTRSRWLRSTSPRASCWPRSTARRWRRRATTSTWRWAWGPASWSSPPWPRAWSSSCPSTRAPRCSSSAWASPRPTSDPAATTRRCSGQLRDRPLVALAPSPAQDANAVVVPAGWRARHGLARSATCGRGAGPHVRGPARLPGAAVLPGRAASSTYGLDFADFLPLDVGGPLTHQALDGGHVDAGAAVHHRSPHRRPTTSSCWPTTAACSRPRTSRRWCGTEVVERWGDDFVAVVDAVSAALTTESCGPERPGGRGRAARPTWPPAGSPTRGWRDRARRGRRPATSVGAPDARSPGPGAGRRRSAAAGDRPGRRRPCPAAWGGPGKRWLVGAGRDGAGHLRAAGSAEARRLVDQADAAVLRALAACARPGSPAWPGRIDRVATGWTLTFFALGVLVAHVVFRRWRHLFTFLASILVMELVGISALPGLLPAPALRRDHHRALGRLLVAVATGGGAGRGAGGHPLHASCPRRAPERRQAVAAGVAGRAGRPPGSTWGRPPLRRGRRAWSSASPSRSPPSGCSRPTRSCPWRTGGARPPTSTSAAAGARPSAGPCATSWG